MASLDDPQGKGGPITLGDGSKVPRLPGYRRWMWDGEFCGSVSFRWMAGTGALPPYVLGQIGYTVVPWKRRLGYATRALALLGTPLTDGDALSFGLAHEVVPDAALAGRALELAATLAAGPASAQAAAKGLLGAQAAALEAALAAEADAQGRLADHADHLEGLAAFAGRRSPRFG